MVGFGFGDAVIMELVKDKGLLPESLKSGNVDDLVYPMNAALRPAAMGIAARLRAAGRSRGSGHRGWEEAEVGV